MMLIKLLMNEWLIYSIIAVFGALVIWASLRAVSDGEEMMKTLEEEAKRLGLETKMVYGYLHFSGVLHGVPVWVEVTGTLVRRGTWGCKMGASHQLKNTEKISQNDLIRLFMEQRAALTPGEEQEPRPNERTLSLEREALRFTLLRDPSTKQIMTSLQALAQLIGALEELLPAEQEVRFEHVHQVVEQGRSW